jgi:hypothetical protein
VDSGEPAPVVTVADANETGRRASVEEPRAHAAKGSPLEVGATTFLLAGVATSGVVGLSAFVIDPLSDDVLLRIAALGGRSPDNSLSTTWAGARLDTCYRMAGNYATGQGLLLGLCGGVDVGLTLLGGSDDPMNRRSAQTLPFVDIGPSVELGAEVGAGWMVVLRAGVGLSVARDAFVDGAGDRIDPSLGTERAEVGVSWKLP